jgi:hypothetical protein
VTGASTCSNTRIEPHELSYGEVTVLSSGGIISKQMKMDLRKQLGYCLTCSHVPVLLIDIRRSRINPLWISKKPRTEDGECIEGRCLRCSSKRDVSCGTPTPSRNVQLTRTFSVASSISSCSIGSSASPLVSTMGPDPNKPSNGQTVSGRMLPPRTPSRSSSGSTAGFYGGSSRRTPPGCYGSRSESPVREDSRGPSSMNSYGDGDSVTQDSHRPFNNISSNCIVRQNSNVTACHPSSSDSSYQTSNDVNKKRATQFVPDTSKIEPIQAMLKEMKSVGEEIFMECLLTAMESNQSDLRVQIYCLTTIRDELENDDNGTISDSFVTTKGILDSMTNFPSSITIQELGCAILLTLASTDNNRTNLIERGSCESLHRAIEVNSRERSIVEMCFSTLRILSTEMEGRNTMLQINVSKTIVAAMQYNLSCVSIQQDGCAIISNLAVDVLNNSVTLVSNDEIAVVLEAMQVHNTDESVMASACFALKNFAYNAQNLRSMNRANNLLEALEDAALFDSLSISASQTSEKLYLSQAEDESMVDHAYKVLMKTISTQSDDPEIMIVIIQSLREFKWSSSHVAACLKKLKPLALTSKPHLLTFLENMTLKELLELNTDFPSVETVKSEVTILARLYDGASGL